MKSSAGPKAHAGNLKHKGASSSAQAFVITINGISTIKINATVHPRSTIEKEIFRSNKVTNDPNTPDPTS